jgi:hypothetical protein
LGSAASGPFTNITGATSNTLATANNVPAGTYYYKVTVTPTASGCNSATNVAAVTVNASPTVAVLSGGGTICPDGSSSIKVDITGGTSPFMINYYEATSLETINGYTSGSLISVAPTTTSSYSLVSVIDTNGCASPVVSGSALVTVAGGVTSASLVGGGTVCSGSSSTIAVAISGGISPYTVTYSDGITELTKTNYISGSPIPVTIGSGDTTFELVSVADAAGCEPPADESTANFTVLESQFANDTTLVACDSGNGMGIFNLTQADAVILNGVTGTVQYYRDAQLTQAISGASSFSSAATTVYAKVTRTPQSCIDSAQVILEVKSLLIIASLADSVCLGKPLQLKATTGNYAISWHGPNNFSSTSASPIVSASATAAMSGNYIVVVTDSLGCTASDTVSVNVQPCCSLSATAPATVNACAGSTVSFSLTIAGAQGTPTIIWRAPNGFSSSSAAVSIPSATTADAGQYSFTVTDDVGCRKEGVVNVSILDTTIEASASPSSTCEGQAITLSATPGGITYQWRGPNGFATTVSVSSFQLTSSATTTMTGTYTVVVTTAVCSGTGTTSVTISPALSLTASISSQTTCSGDEVTIDYTTTPGGQQIVWVKMPGGQTGSGNIIDYPVALGTSPESYTYTASIPTLTNCSSNSAVTIVTVNPRPTVTPSTCTQTICSGQTGEITFIPDIPNSTIHWTRTPTTPAPSSGTGNISQTFTNTGPTSVTYTYQIWAISPGPALCSSSDTITCIIVVTPGLNINAMVAAGSGCIGQPLSLSASVVQPGTYTYNWTGPNGYVGNGNNPLVTASATPTQAGSYTVIVTDAAGCSETAFVPVSLSACCPTPITRATASLCNNETLNLQTYVPAGGSFTLLTGTAGSLSGTTFNGIVSGAGVFKVGYRASGLATNCAPDTITVIVRDCTPPLCNYPINAIAVGATCGNNDGRAEVTLGGAPTSAITSFAWSTGQVGSAISGLAAGIYSVTATVTDGANVCMVIDTVSISNIGAPVMELLQVTPASCQVNGVASLTVVKGTAPFTISWTGAATGSQGPVSLGPVNITNLPAGPYEFRITSAATPGCFGTLSVNIPRSDDTRISLTATPTDATSCSSATGSIQVDVLPAVGVSAPFSYSLNGQFIVTTTLPTYTFTNLAPGVYTVAVSSSTGCTTSPQVVVINVTGTSSVTGWTAQSPACPTDQARLVYAGGQAGTTFRIREAFTGAVVANSVDGANPASLVLSAGTYIVQTTSGTCVSADTLVLNRPQDIDFEVHFTPETCAAGGVGNGDGSLSVIKITGGTDPFTIVVTNNLGQTIDPANFNALPAGNYSVNVVDAHGCSGSEGTLVTVPPCGIVCPKLDFNTVVVDTKCGLNDGEATAQLLNAPTGAGTAVTYLWSNGFIGTTTSNLASGVYSVTAQITSSDIYNGCMYVDTVNVNDIGGPIFTVSPLSPASCTASNGSAVINIQSGTAPFTVSWTGPTTSSQTVPNLGSLTLNGLKSGNYVFTVTSANSTCQGVFDITLPGSSGNLIATVSSSAVTGCGATDGQLFVNVSGGTGPFAYIVNGFVRGFTSNRNFSIQGLPAGTYYVQVTDQNGCTTIRENVLINTVGQPPITGFTNSNPACPQQDGTIAFNGSGVASDTYVVTVAGTATQIGVPFAGNTTPTFSVPSGNYLITRTTSASCVSTTVVSVTQSAGMDFNIQPHDPTCESPASGSLKMIQESGGTGVLSFTVTSATGIVSSLTALTSGSYTVTMGDANGCTLSKVVALTAQNCCDLVATLGAVPTTNCDNVADGRLEIEYTGTDTYQYNVNGGAFQPLTVSPFSVTGLAAGTYTVVVQSTTNPGCMTTLTGEIVTPTAPIVSTVVVTNPTTCTVNDGGLAVVLVNGGAGIFEYSINNGGTWQVGNTFSGLAAGSYTVLVRNAAAPTCVTDGGTFQIQTPGSVIATIDGENQDVCELNQCTITITASGGTGAYEYSLDGGLTWSDLSPNPLVRSQLPPSNYLVIVRDKAIPSCKSQKLVELATEECPVPIPPALER